MVDNNKSSNSTLASPAPRSRSKQQDQRNEKARRLTQAFQRWFMYQEACTHPHTTAAQCHTVRQALGACTVLKEQERVALSTPHEVAYSEAKWLARYRKHSFGSHRATRTASVWGTVPTERMTSGSQTQILLPGDVPNGLPAAHPHIKVR